VAHGASSQPWAWRPAAGARLARTLGLTNAADALHHVNHPHCTRHCPTCRGYRALVSSWVRRRLEGRRAGRPNRSVAPSKLRRYGSARIDSRIHWRSFNAPIQKPKYKNHAGTCRSSRHIIGLVHRRMGSRVSGRQAVPRHSVAAPRGAAPSVWSRHRRAPSISLCRVRPNPSVKRSANGRPPGPGRWYAVHCHQPGPGVLPLSPAYLER
jgi:hypothetical protein